MLQWQIYDGMIHQHLIFVLPPMSKFHLLTWWMILVETGLYKLQCKRKAEANDCHQSVNFRFLHGILQKFGCKND